MVTFVLAFTFGVLGAPYDAKIQWNCQLTADDAIILRNIS